MVTPDAIARAAPSATGNVRMMTIVQEVAAQTGVTVADIMGPGRTRLVAEARQAAMYFCRQEGFSLPQIGRRFKRDHTTVHHNIRAVEERINA